MIGRLGALFEARGSMWSLRWLRVALGPIVLLHLRPFVADLRQGVTYDDRFFAPWLPSALQPPGEVQYVLVALAGLAAVGMTVGVRPQLSSWLAFGAVAANQFLSQTYFRHNRAFLLILLLGVALARGAADEEGELWPQFLLRFQVAAVYFASGFSKLIDPDWLGGTVLWDRAVRFQSEVTASWLPGGLADLIVEVVTDRTFHSFLSPVAVATELFLAFGLWFRPTRRAAVAVAIAFHVGIQLAASVEVFSFAALAALVIWREARISDPPPAADGDGSHSLPSRAYDPQT